MRKTLKTVLISAILVLCIALCCACDPTWHYYDYKELKENVEQVELIEYDNPSAKEVYDWYRNLKSLQGFDFEKVTVIKTLSTEKLDEFLLDLSQYGTSYNWRYKNAPNGVCAKINYKNGDFIILSFGVRGGNGYVGSFHADGSVKDFIGSGFGGDKFFEKYFVDSD